MKLSLIKRMIDLILLKNEYGTEIFLDKPLNIINIMEDIKKLKC